MAMKLPNSKMLDVLRKAHKCKYFGICAEAKYEPENGHVPRGYLGATGALEEVKVVIMLKEPGHPHSIEQHIGSNPEDVLFSTIEYSYGCYDSRKDQLHKNVRDFIDALFPELTFDEQLKKVWITQSRLCSIDDEIGNIAISERRRCLQYNIVEQIKLLPNSEVVISGDASQKAANPSKFPIFENAIKCGAFAPPGCYQKKVIRSQENAVSEFHIRKNETNTKKLGNHEKGQSFFISHLRRWKIAINGDIDFTCTAKEYAGILAQIDKMFLDAGSVSVPTSLKDPWQVPVIDFYKQETQSIAFIVESDDTDLVTRLPKCLLRLEWDFTEGKSGDFKITSGGYSNTVFGPEHENETQIREFEDELIYGLNDWLESIIDGDEKMTIVAAD